MHINVIITLVFLLTRGHSPLEPRAQDSQSYVLYALARGQDTWTPSPIYRPKQT